MGLEGSLKDFDITNILQLIQMGDKDGALVIETVGDKGIIFFENGTVVHAETNREKDINAVNEMLRWSEGKFVFEPDRKADEKTMEIPIQHLMLEAARQVDEWKQIEKVIPSVDVVIDYVPDPQVDTDHIELTGDEWKILSFINGKRTIREIASKVKMSHFDTAKVIYGLVTSGLLQVVHIDDMLSDMEDIVDITEETVETETSETEEGEDANKKKKRFGFF